MYLRVYKMYIIIRSLGDYYVTFAPDIQFIDINPFQSYEEKLSISFLQCNFSGHKLDPSRKMNMIDVETDRYI